jgi:hypothetical protein
MALTKVPLKPGIVKDDAELTVEGSWADGNNVRFVRGSAEKIGGYAKLITDQLLGKARGMLAWVRNNGDPHLAIGTNRKLYAIASDTLRDITPVEVAVTLSGPFAVTNASVTITVTDTAHGQVVGAGLVISGSAAVGGITPVGHYTVITVIDADTYTITHSSAASSTATGGGGAAVAIRYDIVIGNEYGAATFGWGIGPWGAGTWGTPRDAAIVIAPRTWSLANWGENLLAVPRNGGLYEWSTSSGDRAVLISTAEGYSADAPTQITSMFVTPERFIVLLGTKEYGTGTFDPSLVRWCNQEANDEWAQISTNLAGEYKLSSGSRIVAGTVSRLQNLIWTDTSLYSMRYLGDTEFIFGFDLIGTNCGLAGPMAFAEKDGVAFWMTPNGQFMMYDGSAPRALTCPVRRFVFDQIVRSQYDVLTCGLNSEFGEVWWWYPTDPAAPEVNRYVAFNLVENAWHIGDVARTSWVDKSTFSKPVAVGADGYVYIHETGVDADGAALPASIRAAPFDMSDGEQIMAVHRIVPDLELAGTLDIRLETRRWPQGPVEVNKTRTFTTTMQKVDIRAQGRQASLEFTADAVGDWFRLGDIRLDLTEAGRR